ncbi:MAG: oxaloacetate decarboxylase subunit alpha [Lachnospiraceae bacterium]|nr:oxaloacetate decarboxylase subunit alpha [Candidatus Minthocola equi]
MAKPVKIVETVLRDGQQSLIATRMKIEDMLPIVGTMDKVGYHSVEMWGGATFDVCMRYLHEDPWERLRKLRDGFKNTKLQMLLRGQNLLGYRNYPDDVVKYFVQKSIANGIDIMRIFDALNDVRNLEVAIDTAKKEGAHVQPAISYTLGKPYTHEYYMNLAKTLENMGADSICVKDMSGLLIPQEAASLTRDLKSVISVPLDIHTHYTSGEASMSYLRAIDNGADIVDCAISPFALGTSQPSTEVIATALEGTEFDPGLNKEAMLEVAEYFRPIREEALASGLMSSKVLGVDINTLKYQVPGGMLSNLVSQLKDQKAESKFYDVLNEVPRVRADMGEPPLVTPTSQIVGTQAVFNILFGERYKMATAETKSLFAGEYGLCVSPFNEEVKKKVIGDRETITCRPADLLEPGLPKFEKEMAEYKTQDEDVLSYALFPQVAMEYFKYRKARDEGGVLTGEIECSVTPV